MENPCCAQCQAAVVFIILKLASKRDFLRVGLSPNMTGGELAAVVAKMPEADQQAIRATVREILQERDQRSAGADRSKSATASGSPLTQDGSSGNGQQGAGLRSRASVVAVKIDRLGLSWIFHQG